MCIIIVKFISHCITIAFTQIIDFYTNSWSRRLVKILYCMGDKVPYQTTVCIPNIQFSILHYSPFFPSIHFRYVVSLLFSAFLQAKSSSTHKNFTDNLKFPIIEYEITSIINHL